MVAADARTAIMFSLSPGRARDAPEGRIKSEDVPGEGGIRASEGDPPHDRAERRQQHDSWQLPVGPRPRTGEPPPEDQRPQRPHATRTAGRHERERCRAGSREQTRSCLTMGAAPSVADSSREGVALVHSSWPRMSQAAGAGVMAVSKAGTAKCAAAERRSPRHVSPPGTLRSPSSQATRAASGRVGESSPTSVAPRGPHRALLRPGPLIVRTAASHDEPGTTRGSSS